MNDAGAFEWKFSLINIIMYSLRVMHDGKLICYDTKTKSKQKRIFQGVKKIESGKSPEVRIPSFKSSSSTSESNLGALIFFFIYDHLSFIYYSYINFTI